MLSEGDEGFQPRHRARFGDDGAFKLQSVPPGDYRLVAQGDVEGNEGRVTSSMPLAVNGVDMRTVSVALSPGVSVSGRVVVEGVTGATALNPGAVEVIAESADPALPRLRASGWPGPDLGFTIANVGQGTQRIRVAYLPSGWRLKSALLGGEDVADVAFDIRRPEPLQGLTVVLTDQPTSITGAVVNDRGEPLSDYTVVVFPSDERLWLSGSRRIVGRRPDQLGHFEIRDLPAGDYRMAAVEFVEEGEWNDPVFLERLRARALSFTLADGDSVVRDLKVVTLTQP
jgi:ribosomal protein L24